MKKIAFSIVLIAILTVGCFAMGVVPQQMSFSSMESTSVIKFHSSVSLESNSNLNTDLIVKNDGCAFIKGGAIYSFQTGGGYCFEKYNIRNADICKVADDASLVKPDKYQIIKTLHNVTDEASFRYNYFQVTFKDMCINHPNEYKLKNMSDIYNGYIRIGFTQEEVIMSWGKTPEINSTVTAFGSSDQWIYRRYSQYIYFDNGILSSWQKVND